MKYLSCDLRRSSTLIFSLLAGLTVAIWPVRAETQPVSNLWRSIGPYGGDARAFAAVPGEPEHIYLGDTANWIFESGDGGATWTRLSN